MRTALGKFFQKFNLMDRRTTSTFLVSLYDEHEIIIFQPAGTSSRILSMYDAKLNEHPRSLGFISASDLLTSFAEQTIRLTSATEHLVCFSN
jgi:hypothetical protein